jgi:NADH-quinone oxidoreductase subunit M
LGLPGLAGFPAEFQVVSGAWPVFTFITALSMIGLLMTGAYVLKAIQKVLHGPANRELLHHTGGMPDINRREIIALAPLLVLMLAIGVWPYWLMDVINKTVTKLIGG